MYRGKVYLDCYDSIKHFLMMKISLGGNGDPGMQELELDNRMKIGEHRLNIFSVN